jgi:hypothetical protein
VVIVMVQALYLSDPPRVRTTGDGLTDPLGSNYGVIKDFQRPSHDADDHLR